MEINYHSSVIFTKNLEKSKEFYTEFMGQEIELDLEKCIILKCGLSLWEMSENHIIRKSIHKDELKKGNKFEVCFETDQFNDIVKRITNKKIKLVHQITEESWGQFTIRIFDPDNNIVEIGEKLDIFVKRLYEKSKDIDWVHYKTSVPKDIISKIVNS